MDVLNIMRSKCTVKEDYQVYCRVGAVVTLREDLKTYSIPPGAPCPD
jgi:hypothetical protein